MSVVLAVDFDGTLINSENVIHPNDIAILKGEDKIDSVIIIPSTGRPLHSVKRAFVRNGIFTEGLMPLPMVLQNGATAYFPNEKLHSINPIPKSTRNELFSLSQYHKEICFFFFEPDLIHVQWPNPIAILFAKKYDLNTIPFENDHFTEELTKILCISEKKEAIDSFRSGIAGLGLETHLSLQTGPYILEVNQMGVNKGLFLKNLIKDMDLSVKAILSAGDGENDIPLFEVADRSFCPSKSPSVVKDRVDAVIETRNTGILRPMMEEAKKILLTQE